MSELVFRLTALVCYVAYMLVRGVSERRVGRGPKLEQLKAGPARDRFELIVLSISILPTWVYMLSPWLDFAAMGLPDAVRWTGAAVCVVGIAAFAWTHTTLADNWSPVVEAPRAGTLVVTGPYRWVRHPMYTSFFIFNTGIWLLTSNWLAGAPAFFAFVWMYFDRVGREVRMMVDTFGSEYTRYAEKTGRVIPGIGRGRVG